MSPESTLSCLYYYFHTVAGVIRNRLSMILFSFAVAVAVPAIAHGQYYPLLNLDIGAGASGRFTLQVNNSSIGSLNASETTPHVVGSVRYHPKTWLGFQVGITDGTSTDQLSDGKFATARSQVGSVAYLIHSHFRSVQPYIALGAAELRFANGSNTQLRTGGMLEVGVDIPMPNPHFGLTLQTRSTAYRPFKEDSTQTPNGRFAASVEPTALAYVRF